MNTQGSTTITTAWIICALSITATFAYSAYSATITALYVQAVADEAVIQALNHSNCSTARRILEENDLRLHSCQFDTESALQITAMHPRKIGPPLTATATAKVIQWTFPTHLRTAHE